MKNEPAAILGAIQAILALAVSFGLKLDAEQVGAIMAVASAVVALLVRYLSVPVAKLPAPEKTEAAK